MQDTNVQAQLDLLERFPDKLRQQLEGQPEEALSFRPAPDGWSIAEIVGHLIVFDSRWGHRIRQMLAADDPKFVAADPQAAVQQFEFHSRQVAEMLEGFAERRAERVTFLRTLNPTHLTRTGTDPEGNTVSVEDAIGVLVDNDRARGEQITENLQAYQARTT